MANPNGRPALPPEQHLAQSIVMIPFSGCHIWTKGLNSSGYGTTKQHGKYISAHRLAWQVKHGPIPEGMHLMHSCDVRTCVNPEHLSLGTHADNMGDKAAKGRAARKLDIDKVLLIRSDNRNYGQIAKDFAVSADTVGKIKRRMIWAHV